jgi:integrase/recombinase XerD
MHTITLKLKEHRGEERIFAEFPFNKRINDTVRQITGVKWSKTHKGWHLPAEKKSVLALQEKINSIASLDTSVLKKQLEEKKNSALAALPPSTQKIMLHQLSADNQLALDIFIRTLQLKAYSNSTIKTYRNEFMQLLQLLKKKPVNTLTTEDIKRYMVFAMQHQGINENTAHSRLNALKFYFEQVLKREKFFWEIPRPKKPLLLPKLLNETELRKLFNALVNKKHKAMLFTTYSAGLRVSELVNLKITDIDSKRMQIFIHRAKGKKDRYVNLSPVLVDILRSYIKTYKPKPELYLFESDYSQTAYPTRTVQQIFSNAKQKAGISKMVGINSLRHSFATHLLDKGTDIRYIKELLGHFNIKTTERYLHVSKQQLVNIVSPLDDLLQKESIDW